MSGWPPKKNTAFTWTFFIRDANGDPVAGAADLDVQFAVDEAAFGAVAGIEVDEGEGMYSCPILATEMNGDRIGLICKTSTSGAKTAAQVIYTARLQLDDLDPVDINTAPTAPTATTLPFASGKTAEVGAVVRILSATAGAGQSRFVEAFSAGIATVDTWTTTPTGTVVYAHFPVPPGSSTGVFVGSMNADVIDSVALATSAVNEIRDAIVDDATRFAGASIATILADTAELQSVLSAAILARTNNKDLNALLGVADTAGEDVPGQTAFEVADEVYTGATHNVTNSLAKRIRQQQEAGTYSLGAIWVDTVNGVAGTTNFDNGVFLNPVDTMADANTIAVSLKIARFVVGSGSTITFAAAQANETFLGKNWTLALGGQNIGGSHINGAEVSGVSTGLPSLDHCHLNICTFAGGEFTDCALQDAITLSGAVTYSFINCYHAESGAPSTIDFGAAVGTTEVHLHNWHGNITILNMKAGDILHFTCADGTLTLGATCTGGTANLAGTFGFTDSSSGMTINDNGQMYQRVGAPVGADLSADIALIQALLDTTAIAELPAGAPPATPGGIIEAVMLPYMALRNGLVATGNERRIRNDAGTVIAKAPMSDDTTTFDAGELGAP